MAITSIRLEKDTKGLLDKIKDKYEIKTYNTLLNYLSHYVLKNNINPKIDVTGEHQNNLIQLELKLQMMLENLGEKLKRDNTTLRKWVGGITKDHLVPMQKQIYDLSQNLDLGKIKKRANKNR